MSNITAVADQAPPLSFVGHVLTPIAVVAYVAATRPSIAVRAATVAAYAAVAYSALSRRVSVGHKLNTYSVGTWFGTHCFTVWWLLLYEDPVGHIRRVDPPDQVDPKDMPLLKRMWRVITLWFLPRSIGYNTQVGDL